jgi:hypothetical protein
MIGRGIEGAAADPSGSPEREGQPSPPDARTASGKAVAEQQDDQVDTTGGALPEERPRERNERHDVAVSQRNKSDIAPQPDSGSPDDQQLIAKRLHGRALPE